MILCGQERAQWLLWWYSRSGSRLSSLSLQTSNALLSPLRSHLGCAIVSDALRCEGVLKCIPVLL